MAELGMSSSRGNLGLGERFGWGGGGVGLREFGLQVFLGLQLSLYLTAIQVFLDLGSGLQRDSTAPEPKP